MSEIREKVQKDIATLIAAYSCNLDHSLVGSVEDILSIPELAIVDREAELPAIPMKALEDYCKREIKTSEEVFRFARAILDYQFSLIRGAGWVKEIK